MQDYKREFIDFLVRSEVLTFGDFTAKSGRKTPYFVNAGRFRTGAQIQRLGRFYARAIEERLGATVDVLFGPAYKGIPLVVTTAAALWSDYERDLAFCFNRKEAKDHGEGGVLVGHAPRDGDRVLIVEDVTTAGTSVRETVPILRAAAAVELAGLVVAVDRMERGVGERAALAELADEFAMPTFSIVDIDEIIAHLSEHAVDGRQVLGEADRERVRAYRDEYGAPR